MKVGGFEPAVLLHGACDPAQLLGPDRAVEAAFPSFCLAGIANRGRGSRGRRTGPTILATEVTPQRARR